MDCRLTIQDRSQFLKLLEDEKAMANSVNLLVDENGLSRLHGVILSIHPHENDHVIELDSGTSARLSQIVAVNGLFLGDYSEC